MGGRVAGVLRTDRKWILSRALAEPRGGGIRGDQSGQAPSTGVNDSVPPGDARLLGVGNRLVVRVVAESRPQSPRQTRARGSLSSWPLGNRTTRLWGSARRSSPRIRASRRTLKLAAEPSRSFDDLAPTLPTRERRGLGSSHGVEPAPPAVTIDRLLRLTDDVGVLLILWPKADVEQDLLDLCRGWVRLERLKLLISHCA